MGADQNNRQIMGAEKERSKVDRKEPQEKGASGGRRKESEKEEVQAPGRKLG